VPPDLIVHFGALYWRSIGGLGYDSLYLQENDTGPDDCNHAQFGSFLLASPNLPVRGEVEGMRLLDIAPTLLDLAGHAVPESMQGSSLLARADKLTRAAKWSAGQLVEKIGCGDSSGVQNRAVRYGTGELGPVLKKAAFIIAELPA
jgi:hypothetical protein